MGTISSLAQSSLAAAIGWGVFHSLWQVSCVALASALGLWLARRAAPDVRYTIALAGLALMLAWPAATVYGRMQPQGARADVEASRTPLPALPVAPLAPPMLAPQQSVGPASPGIDAAALAAYVPYASLIWALGVVVFSLRALGGWLVAERLRQRYVSLAPDPWQERFSALARRLKLRTRVTLLESSLVEVPTVVGWLKPVVLVPASAFTGLTSGQLEAILVHELAHVRRHDYLANLLQAGVETLLFYHPAVWWLSGLARAEREHCCDDLAVSLCGNRVEYARALADLEVTRRLVPAVVLGADGGSLLRRVARLLGAPPPHDGRRSAWAASAIAAAAMAVVVGAGAPTASSQSPRSGVAVPSYSAQRVVPVPPSAPSPPAPPAPPAAPASDIDTKGCISHSSATEKWAACYKGVVTLTADDADVQRLSPGGSLTIKEGGWFSSRSVELTADASGALRRRYYTGMREQPYEPEGKQLLARYLTQMIRNGFAAGQRVSHLLARGGPDAVLRDIAGLDSDYARKVYYTELFRQETLDTATLARALGAAGGQISSDYESAELLIAVAPRLSSDAGVSSAFFAAADRIGSDYEHHRVLTAVIKRADLDAGTAKRLLASSRGIESDYEHAGFLLDWLKSNQLDPIAADFMAQVDRIGSAYERGRVLSAVLDVPRLAPAALAAALRTAGRMDGAYELSQVLQRAARLHEISGDARAAYLAAADHLEDGYQKDQAYAALVRAERRAKQ